MSLSIAKEDVVASDGHPLSMHGSTDNNSVETLKKNLAVSRQRPNVPGQQDKLAGMDTSFYDLDLNTDPLVQPALDKSLSSLTLETESGIALPPQLHFNQHHEHHRHRHEALTIDDMSEPRSESEDQDGIKARETVIDLSSESAGKILAASASTSASTSASAAAAAAAGTTTTTATTSTTTSATKTTTHPTKNTTGEVAPGWFDLPPSLSGQPPAQRPCLTLSMPTTTAGAAAAAATTKIAAPAPAQLSNSIHSLSKGKQQALSSSTTDIPLDLMGSAKNNKPTMIEAEVENAFTLGMGDDDEMIHFGATDRESRRGEMSR
ncbi:hypothetical protein BGZ94_001021 [Podila epigama]|nr:hypothetical protein BGZ94_001021 [Podila epigama]